MWRHLLGLLYAKFDLCEECGQRVGEEYYGGTWVCGPCSRRLRG
jgi:hypothetical protein